MYVKSFHISIYFLTFLFFYQIYLFLFINNKFYILLTPFYLKYSLEKNYFFKMMFWFVLNKTALFFSIFSILTLNTNYNLNIYYSCIRKWGFYMKRDFSDIESLLSIINDSINIILSLPVLIPLIYNHTKNLFKKIIDLFYDEKKIAELYYNRDKIFKTINNSFQIS